jgi:sulfite reductase (NADPH) flavoprotein alpha-component
VEVDNADAGALRHWQHHLELLGGGTPLPDWSAPEYQRWRLVERRLLNPGSLGGPAYHLALEPLQGIPQWRAGDIAEIGPRNSTQRVAEALQAIGLPAAAPMPDGEALSPWLGRSLLPRDLNELKGVMPEQLAQRLKPLPHREYSIASIPADGRLELLIRQMRQPDGSLGLGSGWLTEHAAVGDEVALRIRDNPGFQPPPDACPLILVGNGTGLAGLRAQLKARVAAGHRRNWLVFGERSAAHDWFHREEIEAWQKAGFLERLDLAFSRDQQQRVYVQDRLREAASELQAWVGEGAAVYVCGSLEGMAPAVGSALADVLGGETLERMLEQGRYRRDVY